jgi:multidrug efflux pump subunit AcrA (membrane-fusion protein)
MTITDLVQPQPVEPEPVGEHQEKPAMAVEEPVSGAKVKKSGRGRRFLRALRTVVVVLILVGGAAAGGAYVVQKRVAAQSYVDIGSAVLTASPVTVGSPDSGTVTTLTVAPQARVQQGQELAYVTMPANGSKGTETRIRRSPSSGTVSAVNVAVGGVAQPGQPIITLYDQKKLTFQAQVPAAELRQLRLGMTAYISGPGLGHKVPAKLQRVVPKVGGDPVGNGDRLTVVLVPVPEEVPTVSTLVPGLEFDASVDTRTATGLTPAVNSA